MDELRACVSLQEEIWGREFGEIVPPSMLMIAGMLGGVTAGAFDENGVLDAFVFGLTGVKDAELVHWSDMLAVRGGVRDRGLGGELKRFQRRVLLERGIRKMFWTVDPLQARNAHLCFAKLGVVVREYIRDMYPLSASPLHRGIGTDRFLSLWLLDSTRVNDRVEGREEGPDIEVSDGVPVALDARASGALPEPGEPRLDLDEERLTVAIPADISRIMSESMDLAVQWRTATRAALTHYLERGWEVREALRGESVSRYLLVRL
jgi:predicted GNAT superfamily acetyltransferase